MHLQFNDDKTMTKTHGFILEKYYNVVINAGHKS